MIVSNVKAKILGGESKPWQMSGNTGVSHKVKVFVEDAIFVCKVADASLVQLAQEHKGKDLVVDFELLSQSDKPVLNILRIQPPK